MLTWWGVYGPTQGRRLRLGLFRDGGRLVGLAPLLHRTHWHRGVVPFRRLEFLASGERDGHGICSNHLNVIAERGAEEAVARSLATAVTAGTFGAWDELVLPMMDGDGPMPALLTAAFRDAGSGRRDGRDESGAVHSAARDLGRLPQRSLLYPPPTSHALASRLRPVGGRHGPPGARDRSRPSLEEGKRVLIEPAPRPLGRGRPIGSVPLAVIPILSRRDDAAAAGARRRWS